MHTYRLDLVRERWRDLPLGHHAILVTDGELVVHGMRCRAGTATYIGIDDELSAIAKGSAQILRFSLVRDSDGASASASASAPDMIMTSVISDIDTNVIMRLDQVRFPPGATAWRHVHPGPGIRYLLRGALELEADDHTKTAVEGDAWFEAANSPVKAMASSTIETAFIRCMILPARFEGQPTINILDATDKARPTLQKNHRYLDQRLTLA